LASSLVASLHVHKISRAFRRPDFIQQSEQFEKLSKSTDWAEKSRPSKKSNSFLEI